MSEPLERLVAERVRLLGSREYAFAMGHGCSMGALDPRELRIVDRVAELTREIAALLDQD